MIDKLFMHYSHSHRSEAEKLQQVHITLPQHISFFFMNGFRLSALQFNAYIIYARM